YRVMLECKTGKGTVSNPDALEASKYKGDYHADACALIGPGYGEDIELQSELRTHGVAAFTVDDLRTLLALGANAHEMRPLFAPGFAADALADLLWSAPTGSPSASPTSPRWSAGPAGPRRSRPPPRAAPPTPRTSTRTRR
ncbi:MAG TPA: hypothetical protein VNJ51_10105, partial [Candidatus Dormibacteraeota bacterium]|nr:hypothetical protein [Candidatus Dormibacteraeota bacterium]